MPADTTQPTPLIFWVAFHVGILTVLAIDLFVFRRRAKPVTLREAALWSLVWVVLSLGFNGVVWYWKGSEQGMEFLTGYIIEKSLSLDNIFVFVVIISYFKVPAKYQPRVLLWGVLGAFLLRGIMIGLGAALVSRFHWVLYFFGAFLMLTGIKMLFFEEDEVKLNKNLVLRMCRRFMPLTPGYVGGKLATRDKGRWTFTPLALVLVMINFIDLVFALDSIPAIFAITTDPFIVYTSNICAVLGLRALYFLLADVIRRFAYLKTGLAIVLVLIGIKMLIADVWKVPTWISLALVLVVLTASIVPSFFVKQEHPGR